MRRFRGKTYHEDIEVSGTVTAASVATGAGTVQRTELSAAAARKSIQVVAPTIATSAAAYDAYVIAPEAGTIEGIDFSGIDALAAHNTNYITFSVTNLGQAGAGNTAMLAASDANTTKATGGTALVANGKRSLTLHGTAANKVVAAGDRIKLTATVSGTLANTVTVPVYLVRFGGTT